MGTTTVKITFWNLHGFANLEPSSIIDDSDVIAANETWITHPYTPGFLNKYNIFWSEALREHAVGRASGGLVTAINSQHNSSIIKTSPWWIFTEVQLGTSVAIIGSVYLRKCIDLNYILDILQETIDEIKTHRAFDLFIIGGDMNAKVGQLNPWPADLFTGCRIYDTRHTTDNSTCERGRRIMEFMVDNDFVLLIGRTISDSPAQPTYDNLGSSIIDLVWIDIASLHRVIDLEVVLEPSLSDHYPICLSISQEVYSLPAKKESLTYPQHTRIRWTDNAAEQYLEHLSNFLITADTASLSTEYLQ